MTNKKDKTIEEQFDEKFEEDFYDLHYRFCGIADAEKNVICDKQKRHLKEEIKTFIKDLLKQQHQDTIKEVIKGLPKQKMEADAYTKGIRKMITRSDCKHYQNGYNQCLSDIKKLIGDI